MDDTDALTISKLPTLPLIVGLGIRGAGGLLRDASITLALRRASKPPHKIPSLVRLIVGYEARASEAIQMSLPFDEYVQLSSFQPPLTVLI